MNFTALLQWMNFPRRLLLASVCAATVGLSAIDAAAQAFSFYNPSTTRTLVEDRDGDTYYSKFSVTFDADVSSGSASVYAKMYLRLGTGSWGLYYTTPSFTITGYNASDAMTVTTTLNTGYAPGPYDVRIELYKTGTTTPMLAWTDPTTASALNDLKLESQDNDVPFSPPSLVSADCYVSPTATTPGGRLMVYYRINNPNSSSISVGLGCSIRKNGTSTWIDDTNDDVYKSCPVGYSTQTRYFDVPLDAQGTYDVAWGLWQTIGTGSRWATLEKVNQFSVSGGSCTIQLTVRDADNQGLAGCKGEYYAGGTLRWSKDTDANGLVSDASSPVGASAYCRARTISAHIDARDEDSGSSTVQVDTPTFSTAPGGTYPRTIPLGNASGVNAREASVSFRETTRAWTYANNTYSYQRGLTTIYVDSSRGPSCAGDVLYFPHGRAVLDNGLPSAAATIDDTMLHEYGHALQWAAYGNTWGQPAGCTCSNHGGTGNDCSHDALIEGWATYFPVMVYHHINSSDTHYDYSASTTREDLESNSVTSMEERDEDSVAGVFWDIYDSASDAGDTLSLGDDEVWVVMRNDRPQTFEEFFQRFCARYPANAAAVEQICIAHGMHPNWLTLSRTSLDFGQSSAQQTFTIRRVGWYGDGTPAAVTPDWSITKSVPWIASVTPLSGDTTTETDLITVTIDRNALASGLNTGQLTVTPGHYGRAQVIAVTATKNPPGTVQLSSATYSVNENGGTVTITATRTGGSYGAASVYYATANGTATAGSDYTAKSGTLSWGDGDAANKSFTVTILNDSAYEGNETFTVSLSGASGATLGSLSTATVTITDDDTTIPRNLLLPSNGGKLERFTSQYSATTGRAAGLTDGITIGGKSGEWGWASSLLPTVPQEFVYSFDGGKAAKIQKIVFYNFGQNAKNRYSKDFAVEISQDGVTYTRLVNGTLPVSTAPVTYTLAESTARYLKLKITSGHDSLIWELAEFEAWGYTVNGVGLSSQGTPLSEESESGSLAVESRVVQIATPDGDGETWPRVWTSGDCAAEFAGINLTDGDTNTVWIGKAGGTPWAVSLDFGEPIQLKRLEVIFSEKPWFNIGIVGSANATEWYDLNRVTTWPVSCRYIYLSLWDDGSATAPPSIREILWDEE